MKVLTFFEVQDNDKGFIISLDKIDLSDSDATEGDDVDQLLPSIPTVLLDPGFGPARNWSLDMIVNE
eukprot:7897427-Ditylum_brightwellii.AAC.1